MHITHGFYMERVCCKVANNFTNYNSLSKFQAIDIYITIIQFNFCLNLVTWVSSFSIPILDSVFQIFFA